MRVHTARHGLRRALLRRAAYSTASQQPWHVAIVGSGPAAFYAADQLLKNDPEVRVDFYEQLPVPFGLVRFGVAPDHQDVKTVTERFEQIERESKGRVSYAGNVHVGAPGAGRPGQASLELGTLREHYSAVLLAYGAADDRTLGVPGEELAGVHAARQFVEWYNGHPQAAGESFDLSRCETAVIVGNGNVALDCARVLAKSVDELAKTDIADHALAELAGSQIRQVVLLGRRGVLQAAFTIKEFRALTKLGGAVCSIEAPTGAFDVAVMEAAAADRARKRMTELMKASFAAYDGPAARTAAGGVGTAEAEGRRVRVQFQRSPVGFEGDVEGRLAAVHVDETSLVGEPGAQQKAVAIEGSTCSLPAQLCLRAVGYRSTPLAGAPFDDKRGVVPNVGGVVTGDGDEARGLYVAGWLKRGPTGVILTNVGDAAETAAAILRDRSAGALPEDASSSLSGAGKAGREGVAPLLAAQAAPVVDFGGWLRIDAEERRRGAAKGKVRDKLVDVGEMLRVAAA